MGWTPAFDRILSENRCRIITQFNFSGLRSHQTTHQAICALHFCSLDLRRAAVHKEFHTVDIAAVVGGKEHHGFGDFIRRARPA